jgi:sulfatase maturation enzyme AslB (radical SAM superfamily)
MLKYTDIRSVHLEISTRCNAACPECPRNFRGVDTIDAYPICDMSLDQAKKIFSPQFLKQIHHILINGNYGDFITARDGLEIVEYFRSENKNLEIEISTNASGKPNVWSKLGELRTKVHFRLDGLADTHHLYRQYTDFDLILANAAKFIAAGGYAIWAFILFNHNEHQIEQAKELSKQLGFKEFQIVDAGRNVGPVFKRDGTYSHSLGNYNGSKNFEELYSQHLHYVDKPEITILNSDHPNRKIDCFAKKQKEIYITANGELYPCCWLGFYPKSETGNPSNIQLRPIIKNNNALEYGLETAIEWFNKIEESWTKTSVREGKIYTCNETCGIK